MSEESKIKKKLEELMIFHRELDEKILVSKNSDILQIKRLKKQKLLIKDEIAKLKAFLYSDIIA